MCTYIIIWATKLFSFPLEGESEAEIEVELEGGRKTDC